MEFIFVLFNGFFLIVQGVFSVDLSYWSFRVPCYTGFGVRISAALLTSCVVTLANALSEAAACLWV